MNKMIIIALTGILLLTFISCATEEDDNINNALKISTYLFDKSIEESPADWDSNKMLPLEQLKLNDRRLRNKNNLTSHENADFMGLFLAKYNNRVTMLFTIMFKVEKNHTF